MHLGSWLPWRRAGKQNRMQLRSVQSVPASSAGSARSLSVGPPWRRDETLRCVRRAGLLLRPAAQSAAGGGMRSGPLDASQRPPDPPVPVPPPGLREMCAGRSSAAAAAYMRAVREVEVRLRHEAARVSQEGAKLQREREHVERVLRSVRTHRRVNLRSSAWRGGRPEPDGAEKLLLWEKRELRGVEEELEAALGETWTLMEALDAVAHQLQDVASERSRVLDLLPPRSSAGPPTHEDPEADPLSPFTPECKQVLEASSRTVGQSVRLRDDLRRLLSGATARQDAAHRYVNDGLVKTIAKTTHLQQALSVASAATRHAVSRKQREVDFIRNSHGTAQGPESSGDMLSREKLVRPLVQVYHRHPGTQLPEAAQLIQGCALLRRRLRTSEGDMECLHSVSSLLMDHMSAKKAAAHMNAAVLRMRRQQVDRRAVPAFLQRGAL